MGQLAAFLQRGPIDGLEPLELSLGRISADGEEKIGPFQVHHLFQHGNGTPLGRSRRCVDLFPLPFQEFRALLLVKMRLDRIAQSGVKGLHEIRDVLHSVLKVWVLQCLSDQFVLIGDFGGENRTQFLNGAEGGVLVERQFEPGRGHVHAGCQHHARHQTHLTFLVESTAVGIVATLLGRFEFGFADIDDQPQRNFSRLEGRMHQARERRARLVRGRIKPDGAFAAFGLDAKANDSVG